MSQPFIGEVKITGFNFPPKGWAACGGQLLPINQNQALFSILGTTYGGNGQTNFALPNLQGRTPIHWGNGQGLPGVAIGQSAGEAAHTLVVAEMAAHGHPANGSSAGAQASVGPAGAMLATTTNGSETYSQTTPNTALVAGTVGTFSGGQPHNNLQPYLVLNFIIALTGVFPTRN